MAKRPETPENVTLENVARVMRALFKEFGDPNYPKRAYVEAVLGHGASTDEAIIQFASYGHLFGGGPVATYLQATFDHDRGLEAMAAWLFQRPITPPNVEPYKGDVPTADEAEILKRAVKGITWAGNLTTESDEELVARDAFYFGSVANDPKFAGIDQEFRWVATMTGVFPRVAGPFGATPAVNLDDLRGLSFSACLRVLQGKPA